jgi:hypothetical protein
VLAAGSLSVVEGVTRWEASEGTVMGHRAILSLDARRLGMLRAFPRVADEVVAALSAALARRPREALSALGFRWSGASAPRQMGYRDAPPATPTLGLEEALAEYAEGAGEPEMAEVVARAKVEVGPVIYLWVHVSDLDVARSPRAQTFFTRAARDLVADEHATMTVRCRG